jgi:hypothetical protein
VPQGIAAMMKAWKMRRIGSFRAKKGEAKGKREENKHEADHKQCVSKP